MISCLSQHYCNTSCQVMNHPPCMLHMAGTTYPISLDLKLICLFWVTACRNRLRAQGLQPDMAQKISSLVDQFAKRWHIHNIITVWNYANPKWQNPVLTWSWITINIPVLIISTYARSNMATYHVFSLSTSNQETYIHALFDIFSSLHVVFNCLCLYI